MADKKTERDHLEDILIEWAPRINMHASMLTKGNRLPPHIELTDLHTAGMHGLIDAFHKYDAKRGASFSTYANSRIRGKMKDHIVSSGGENAVDYFHYQKAKKFQAEQKAKPETVETPRAPEAPEMPKNKE
jgi:DNA-directed RNA polymerase specialized sigma subunit